MDQKTSLPEKVKRVIKIFHDHGFEIYIIGGTARGLLTSWPIKDWDFTTKATPKQIQALFPKNSFYKNKFGTVSIVMGKGEKNVFQVTTYRTEEGYSDRRRPDKVSWGKTVEEDLARRDFTINAIALEFKKIKNKWQLTKTIDPYKGQEDLKKKILRAVGNANKRFQEDAHRLIRAVRIATQLGF